MDWSNFFAMGGYAAFVWSAYGITAVVLIANVLQPWRRERALMARERERRMRP